MSSKAVKETLSGLDERVVAFINKFALSGMGVGVVQDGKLIYGKGFGLAEAKTRKPITTDKTLPTLRTISNIKLKEMIKIAGDINKVINKSR